MYRIIATNLYKKSIKRIKKRGLDLSKLETVVNTIAQGKPLHSNYKDHILKGKYTGFHECHIQPDWLLVYYIENNKLVLTLVDTGSHSDLF